MIVKNTLRFDNIIIILLCLSFVLVDLRLEMVTFSDITLIILISLLLFHNLKNKDFCLSKSQLYLFITLLSLILLNILLNLFFNIEFSPIKGLQGLIKVGFYFSVIIIVYNFFQKRKLQLRLLNSLSTTAVIVSIIGVYITVSLFLNGLLPYEFLWEFTRDDPNSYLYRGWDRNIIRTRSIFAEPSHLGFYLNTILALLYFNNQNYTIQKKHELIIIISILLTFSYSSILIMTGIILMKYLNWFTVISFLNKKRNIVFIFLVIVALFVFKDTIEKTIIIRTQELLSGSDGSALKRLEGSWSYINYDQLITGNGIGNTPPIWNIYAYILSDLGIIVFLMFSIINITLFFYNSKLAVVLIALGFQKGGYLSATFWIFLLLIFIYSLSVTKKEVSTLSINESKAIINTRNK